MQANQGDAVTSTPTRSDQIWQNAPPSIFLTGGAGYVGRNLIHHFVDLGCKVTALVRTAAGASKVESLGASAVPGDLLTAPLDEVLSGATVLIHAAADTDHGFGGRAQYRTNVDGTQRVLEAARRAGIRKVILVSTESVLLDGRPLVFANETLPFPSRPVGSYSKTKAAAERLSFALATPDFEVLVVRPRFVWGRDDTTALPQLLQAVRSGQFAWIDGGSYLTSTTHIANLCHGIELAIKKGRNREVYFITDGEPVVFREFITGMLETQGVDPGERIVPRGLLRAIAAVSDAMAVVSQGRVSGPINLQTYATSAVEVTLDISKARKALGYSPIVSMNQGMAELVEMSKVRK